MHMKINTIFATGPLRYDCVPVLLSPGRRWGQEGSRLIRGGGSPGETPRRQESRGQGRRGPARGGDKAWAAQAPGPPAAQTQPPTRPVSHPRRERRSCTAALPTGL